MTRTSYLISQGESTPQLSPATTPEEMALLGVSAAVGTEAEAVVAVVGTIATIKRSTSTMMIPIGNRPKREHKTGIRLTIQTYSPEPSCIL